VIVDSKQKECQWVERSRGFVVEKTWPESKELLPMGSSLPTCWGHTPSESQVVTHHLNTSISVLAWYGSHVHNLGLHPCCGAPTDLMLT